MTGLGNHGRIGPISRAPVVLIQARLSLPIQLSGRVVGRGDKYLVADRAVGGTDGVVTDIFRVAQHRCPFLSVYRSQTVSIGLALPRCPFAAAHNRSCQRSSRPACLMMPVQVAVRRCLGRHAPGAAGGPGAASAAAVPANAHARVLEGFRLSTIELGIRIVAPRSLVVS